MEFGSDEEFEKRGLADPDASKDDPENEATKETMKKGAAKVVGREQTTKTLGAGKGGKVGEVEELPTKKSRPVKLANVNKDPELYGKDMQSIRTKRSTNYAVSTFNDTMRAALGDAHQDLHQIPIDELPSKLASFFMLVLKKDGDPMNASSLRTLHQSLARFLSEDYPDKVDIKSDVRFKVVSANLKAAQRASCLAGQVPGKQRSEPFQDQHLAQCWDGGSLGRGNPRALAATVHMTCMSQLGFRAIQECVQMKNEDIVFGQIGKGGVPNKLTVSERVTKTRQGSRGHSSVRELQPTIYPDHQNPDTCPVRNFLEFQGRKTEKQREPSQRFFLTVKQSAQLKPKEQEYWYTNQPMGEKEIAKLIPDSFKEVGVDPVKERITATSTRKFSLETVLGKGVPSPMVSGLAGHANANSLKSYVKGTAKAHEAMSLVMSRQMGQKKVGRFEDVVNSIEVAQEEERVDRVGDQGQKTGAEDKEAAYQQEQSQGPATPTTQMVAQSITPNILPGMTPFGFPTTSFQQQMLMAQQLSLASNPMLMMMAPQAPQFFQPGTMPFLTNQAAQISPLHAPPAPPQLEKELANLQKQQEKSLAEQKQLFEEQLQTRDRLFKEQQEARDQEFAVKLQRMEAYAKMQEESLKKEEER